jgi:hypothetical protein
MTMTDRQWLGRADGHRSQSSTIRIAAMSGDNHTRAARGCGRVRVMTVPRTQRWVELAVLGGGTLWFAITGRAHTVDAGATAITALGHAIAGAVVLALVVVAARQLLPREPVGGALGAIVLALAPPFRDAVAFDLTSVCAAAAAIAIVIAIGSVRANERRMAGAFAAAAIVALALAISGVLGPLPPIMPGLAAIVTATGRGAATIVVAAGLLGASFGSLTGLRGARVVLGAIAIGAIIGLGVPLLGILAIGAAIVPAAIVRATLPDAAGIRRHLITLATGIPLIAGSAITGAAIAPTPTTSAPPA